jgi:hypothetical protein
VVSKSEKTEARRVELAGFSISKTKGIMLPQKPKKMQFILVLSD